MKRKNKTSEEKENGKNKSKEKGKENVKDKSSHKIFKKRFRVPIGLECKKCFFGIDKDVKVSALKKQVGHYCGKKIWSYAFKCPSCDYKIVVDRRNAEYKLIKGACRKEDVKKEDVTKKDPWKRLGSSSAEMDEMYKEHMEEYGAYFDKYKSSI